MIGSRLPDLKRAGSAFKALCPFHKEKTPSFHVNAQRQLFKCFGCGVGGDVFKFVMLWDRMTFPEAVEQLARRAGIALEYTAKRDPGAASQKELLFKLHEEVAAFFHRQLMKEPAAQIARDYLKKRKVMREAAREFMLGYSPDSWDAVLQWGQSRKYTPKLLELAGLAVPRESGGGHYDRFRGRLMFPIRDEPGRVVGFSGRVLTGDEQTAKYVNSPETPIFNKGRVLYGLDKTKRAIIEARQAIVCEGQLDLIACYTAGVQNVVAPQGTAFTGDHGRILKRYADEVVLCFDADAAGQNAAVRSVEELLSAGLVVRVVTMPAGHDPDSLVRDEGPDRLRAVVGGARPFFDFLLDYLCKRHDPQSDTGRIQISQALAESLAKVSNAVLRATYLQRSAARLNVPEAALREEIAKAGKRLQRAVDLSEREPGDETPAQTPSLPAERLLLQLMLGCPETVEPCCEALNPLWLTPSLAGEMIAAVHRLRGAGRWRDQEQLLDAFPDAQDLLADLLVDFRAPADPAAAALDCVQSLKRRWAKARIEGLTQRLRQPGLSADEVLRIQKQILDLK